MCTFLYFGDLNIFYRPTNSIYFGIQDCLLMGCMLIRPLKVVIISAINQNGQCHLLGTGENGAIQTFHRSLPKLRFTTSKHFLSPRHTVVAITDFSSTGRPVNKCSLNGWLAQDNHWQIKKNTVVCIVLNNGTEPFSF